MEAIIFGVLSGVIVWLLILALKTIILDRGK